MKKYIITIFAAMLLLFITACGSDEYKASVDELRLVQVKPTNVYSGEIATILGRNFSIVSDENEVTINGKQATVLESSKNDMKIILPELEPGTYPISVKSPSGELTGLEITYLKTPEHDYLVQTIIGQKGVYEMKDGVGTDATTKLPTGLAFAPDGSIWFTERGYNYVRRIAPDFSVSTLIDVKVDASSAIWQGEFNSNGDFYFADKAKGMVRKLDVNKMEVSTFASGLKSPMNVIFDDEDNIYVSARDNKIIYKYTPSGKKSTFAKLTFSPTYIVFDKNKNMIVGTSNGYCLIQIDKDGEQTTIAGDGVKGTAYDDGETGNPLTAKIGVIYGIAAGSDGCLYISDNTYNCIRKLTPDENGDYSKGTLETIAGSGKAGAADGKGLKATFKQPYDIKITDDCKTIYVAGAVNYVIRRITVR